MVGHFHAFGEGIVGTQSQCLRGLEGPLALTGQSMADRKGTSSVGQFLDFGFRRKVIQVFLHVVII